MMEQVIKAMIREKMYQIAAETVKDNPMKGTPFEGFAVQTAIVTANKSFKENFIEGRHEFGLSESTINEIVDDVTKEILDEFLEY